MIFPFVTRSLTATVEKKIHLALRRIAPVKYWTFRISSLLERIGGVIGIASFFIWFVSFKVAHYGGQLDSKSFDLLSDALAVSIVAAVGLSIVGAIFATTTHRELEQLVEQILRDLYKSET